MSAMPTSVPTMFIPKRITTGQVAMVSVASVVVVCLVALVSYWVYVAIDGMLRML